MCLYIGNKEGFTAKTRIKVYKVLARDGMGGYQTPCRNWPVKLGSVLVPDEKKPEVSEYGFKWQINGGAIHAYLKAPKNGDICFEAYIPQGSQFWIQDDLTEIAAEKLELTDVESKDGEETDLSEYYHLGSRVYLSDGSYHDLLDSDYSKEDVIGIEAYPGKIIALDFSEPIQFSESRLPKKPSTSTTSQDSAEADMNGRGNTEEMKDYKSLAVEYCLKYKTKGTKKGDWYLPALGELQKAFKNLLSINLSLRYLGKPTIPMTWFWSSTVYDEDRIWCCHTSGDASNWRWYYWDYRGYVVPFLEALVKKESE